MTTPQQRLARMRKSFEKNKSVLTEDYKYFTTPDAPAKPRASIPQSKAARMSAEQSAQKSQNGVEGIHRIEATVETKHEFIEIGLQMTRFDPAMMRAVNPRLQIGEDEMD